MPIKEDVVIGKDTKIHHPDLVNLYGCTIGDNCNIGAFVEIGKGVTIGNNVSIGAHCFIPEGVTIEDNCFIGPRVTFCNDFYPPSYGKHWGRILVKKGVSIGAGCIIIPGITIYEGAMIGAGSVVTKDVKENILTYGNPSRHSGKENPLFTAMFNAGIIPSIQKEDSSPPEVLPKAFSSAEYSNLCDTCQNNFPECKAEEVTFACDIFETKSDAVVRCTGYQI